MSTHNCPVKRCCTIVTSWPIHIGSSLDQHLHRFHMTMLTGEMQRGGRHIIGCEKISIRFLEQRSKNLWLATPRSLVNWHQSRVFLVFQGSLFEQKSYNFVMPILCRHSNRRGVIISTNGINVCLGLNQFLTNKQIPLPRCHMQGCSSNVVGGTLGLGTLFQQDIGDICMAAERSKMQRGGASIDRWDIDGSLEVNKHKKNIQMALRGSKMHCRDMVLIFGQGIFVSPFLHQQANECGMTTLSRKM
mmetsp:Transcript_468/g.927  ORF Transcript_468/g.927 Transcript_468/m.927 type:complete len:246 (-) Transcript_468:507-1244(-)